MPDIRLRDYVAKIKDLVRTNLEDEAIAHCQHILHQYPKHVETYCLLGEACLEKRMYREAIEFFQRTLSADPENLIARVGLGVIYDEQGAIAEAIWQMEQAFELAPGNTEVRRELQRLYSQRDGREKSRLKLTRGALGRLYVRNGLYERALGEFRAVLRQDPDLPSIRVSLIEALWREGRRLEAVETCLDLLEALPYCLKANLILGEIWLRGGNEEAGQEKLDVARALDPENLIAQELMGRNSPLPTEEVLIDELEVTATMLSAFFGEEEQVAEAGEGIEEAFAAEVEEAWGEQEEVPDWLEAMGLTETAQAALLEAGEEEALPEELPPVEEIPDWLKELGVSSTEEAPAVLEEEEPAAPEAEVATTLEEEALAALEEEMLAAQEEVAATAEEAEAEPVAEAPAEVLGEVSVGEPAPAEEIETAEVTEEEIPDWLRELERPEVEGEGPPPAAEEVAEEALEAWEEETPEAIAEEEPTVLQAEIPVALEEEGPVVLEEAPVAEEAAALEEEPATEAAPVAEVPESLWALVEAGILDEADLETAMAEMSAEDLEAQREEAVPDWLQELMGEEAAAPEEELAVEEEPVAEEEAEAEPVAEAPAEVSAEISGEEPAPADEIPDWLRELGEPVATAEIETAEVTEEEIPEWLREIETPEVEEEGPPPVAEEVAEAEEQEEPIAVAGEAVEALEEKVPEAIAEEETAVLEEEAPVAEQAEAALEEEPAAEAAPVAEVPESLRALVEAGILDEADLETAMAEMSAEDLEAQREEAVPDWLQELMGEEAAAPEEELAAEEEPVAEEEAEAEPVAEAPAEISGEPSGEEPAPAEEIPDWLRELGEPVAAAEIETAEMPEEEIPEWLGELETPEVEEEGPLPVAEEVAKEEEQEEPIAVAGEAVEAPEAEVPAVAEAAPAEEVELEAEEAVPEWLQELMGEEASLAEEESAESAAEAQEEAAGERVPAEEVPGWLLELEELEAEEEVSEEIPQWLREFQVPDTEDLVPPSAEQAPSVEAAAPEAESMAEEHEVEAGAPGWLQELMVEETAAVEEQELSPVAEAEEEVAAEPEAVSGEAEASQAEVPEAIVSEPEIPEAEEPTAEKAAPPAGMEMKAPLDRISVEKVETVPKTEEPTGMSVPTATPATEKEMVAPFDRVEVEEKVSAPPRIEELLAHLQSKPRDYRARMELARIYSVEKDWTAALKQYEKLISARKLLPAVIEELEALRQEQVDEIRLFQLLGDAYMQDDQLDKALEMYRLARQALAKR